MRLTLNFDIEWRGRQESVWPEEIPRECQFLGADSQSYTIMPLKIHAPGNRINKFTTSVPRYKIRTYRRCSGHRRVFIAIGPVSIVG